MEEDSKAGQGSGGSRIHSEESEFDRICCFRIKDIQDIPVANTTTLLQGRLPGLVLTQDSAQAGNDNPEIRIRGIGTFGNNNPMVLIDGVEGSISNCRNPFCRY